ncbi:MAG TPA: hypothetical protein VGO62_02975, partial [Myxococcota bacterium]
ADELRELDIEGNRVASLAPLANKRHLRNVYCGENPLADLSVLASCPSLEVVECFGCPGLVGGLALAKLPALVRLTSHGSLPASEIASLRAVRPDVDVD